MNALNEQTNKSVMTLSNVKVDETQLSKEFSTNTNKYLTDILAAAFHSKLNQNNTNLNSNVPTVVLHNKGVNRK
jgi:hypothetical protein